MNPRGDLPRVLLSRHGCDLSYLSLFFGPPPSMFWRQQRESTPRSTNPGAYAVTWTNGPDRRFAAFSTLSHIVEKENMKTPTDTHSPSRNHEHEDAHTHTHTRHT